MDIRKIGRSVQINMPFLQDLKFSVLRNIRTFLKKPDENDFRAIGLLNGIENNLFLDIGANRGQSIDGMKMFHKNLDIHSFEPNPLLSEKLEKIYSKKDVTVHNFGLGDEAGEFTLYVPFYKKYMFDGLASFHEENATNWLRTRMYNYKEKHLSIRRISCKIKKLDDLNLKPFFIKMDVQGHELPALRGAEKTLKESTPVLLLESPEDEITEYLKKFGYRKYAYIDDMFILDGKSMPNSFFITDDKLKEFHIEKTK